MMKITIVGAGNVGATCARVLAQKNLVKKILLLDIKENFAEGKALDIWQSAPILGFNTRVEGITKNYEKTKDSDVIVITSGVPRKPGMSRDDLISINAKIIKDVVRESLKYSPNAIFIVVSNPLDVMTYVAYQTYQSAKINSSQSPEIDSSKVFGMAGILDTARYRAFIASELDCSPEDIQALLLGGHGDTMVPLAGYTTVAGTPITELMEEEKLNAIIERTKKGGGEIVNLLNTSAWEAPGAAAAQMVEAIVKDSKRIFPCCAYLEGQYGFKDIYLGVPVVLGKNGIEKIIELKLNEKEEKLLEASVKAVRETLEVLKNIDLD